MDNITIKGQPFAREDVIKAGAESLKRARLMYDIVAHVVCVLGILFLVYGIYNFFTGGSHRIVIGILSILMSVPIFASCVVLFKIARSNIKIDPLLRGIKILESTIL